MDLKQYYKERRARIKTEKEKSYVTSGLKRIVAELKTQALNDKCYKLVERMCDYLDAEGIITYKDSEGESGDDPDELEIVQDENGDRYQILGVEEMSDNEDEGHNGTEISSGNAKCSNTNTLNSPSEDSNKIPKKA